VSAELELTQNISKYLKISQNNSKGGVGETEIWKTESRKQKWWRPKNGTPFFVLSQSHPIRNPFEESNCQPRKLSGQEAQRRKGARKEKPLRLGGFA
jgi:hypothetical protein